MPTNLITEQIERYKLLADEFLKEDKRIFIKDLNYHWYFADILFVGEKFLEVQCFSPEQINGQKFQIRWASIKLFEEFREEGGKR